MIPARIVLDTNVCLDLFIFRDPGCLKIMTAIKNGNVKAFTNEACRDEWLRVIDYPQLALAVHSKHESIAEFDLLIHRISPAKISTIFLPVCSDEDDQKFLEFARDVKADFLITKDKALLRLHRKTAAAGLFSIVRPLTLSKLLRF